MNLSVKQYRNIDLIIMLIMLAAAEALITVAARVWFPYELYSLSPTAAIVCIGEKTADAVRRHGESRVLTAEDNDTAAVAALILRDMAEKRSMNSRKEEMRK